MISPHIFRNALWLTLVLTFAASAAAQPATLETPELPPAVEAPPETDITARSEQAIQELGDIGRQIDELGNIDSAKERLAALQAQYQGLLPEGVSIELSASNGAEYDADNLRAQALALSKRSTEITDELSIEAEALEDALETAHAAKDKRWT